MNQKFYAILVALFFVATQGFSQTTITIGDDDLQGGQTYNWTADNIYLLDGFVFLEEGGILNIAPGTVVKGKESPTTNDNASALIITRGAQIFANGTEEAPIIFTAEEDDPADVEDNVEAFDRGLWGGLILLGNAVIANATDTTRVEGIPEGEPRALFGGDNDEDNSGVLKYVSIRHGGAELSPGDEINGLTLGAVGSMTTIEHVEVLSNADDGIEFFGGTVNVKFATVAFCGDDAFDWDLGYRGKGQFWFALVQEDNGDNTGELDGAGGSDDNEPHSSPEIYNATWVGAGCDGNADNATNVYIRDGGGGRFSNSIFTASVHGIEIEDKSGVDSRQRYEEGSAAFNNNLWFGFCNGNELNGGANGFIRPTEGLMASDVQWLIDSLVAQGNSLDNPNFNSISRTNDGMLDPRPEFGGPAYQNLFDLPEDDDFFQVANYKGAFSNNLWVRGWTGLDIYGFIPDPEPSVACENTVIIRDGDLVGGETYNWTNDRCYILDGFVFLEEGGVLNIQEGTNILGRETPSTNDNASALIITRGAQIFAEGTEENPIIFTTELDDLDDDEDLEVEDRGLWGGLIILGEAVIANATPETRVEGIPEGEPRALFGGTNDEDNSGVLKYVSIRHGGAELAPGDEINGLTLGAVGSGTIMEHIEVLSNLDDGIEFFGGTVSLKFATVAFCGDDCFDWDLGYRGKGQFWFALVGENDGDNAGELDGAGGSDDNEPHSSPEVYNVTWIGAGCDGGADNATSVYIRDGGGGRFTNSIFTASIHGIEIEDKSGVDSRQRYEEGSAAFNNNLWYNFCNGNELNGGPNGFIRPTSGEDVQWLIDSLVAQGNALDNPNLAGVSRANDGGLDPRPEFGGPAYQNTADLVDDDFFQVANYKGAFGSGLWLRSWTALDAYGFLPEESSSAVSCPNFVVIRDGDLEGNTTYNWTNDNCYLLDGFVFLEAGGVLNIQPGTKIFGRETPSTNDNASALIITRDAQIFAEGTADQPIIFTSELDDIDDDEDLELTDRGLWGGLIILGNAVIANATDETRVEGIPEGEPRALFGGDNDADNSGILSYVSIRHGGAELAPGDEINGLTLGAVGSMTTLDHIEVIANLDDGIEFFGGTVPLKYASVSYCGDDSYDWDLGYRGKGQFWFALVGDDDGDNAGELDGAGGSDDNEPHSAPNVFNVTWVGAGCDGSADNATSVYIRDGGGGKFQNSIFTQSIHGVEIEDKSGVDSRQRLEVDGTLALENNLWWDFCNGNELNGGENGFIRPTSGAEDVQWLIDYLAGAGNQVVDPELTIAYDASGILDPRAGDAAFVTEDGVLTEIPDDDFYTNVCFRGAFVPNAGMNPDEIWLEGWTALSEYGALNPALDFGNPEEAVSCVTSTFELVQDGYVLTQNIPNPFSDITQISFTLPRKDVVTLTVFDMTGRQIARLIDFDEYAEGTYNVEFNGSDLPNGLYYYNLTTQNVSLTKELIIVK